MEKIRIKRIETVGYIITNWKTSSIVWTNFPTSEPNISNRFTSPSSANPFSDTNF